MQEITMIVAMTNAGVIGDNNKLLWHLPHDLSYFKKHTLNKPVIMGRKTYDAIGRPLAGRRNIVLTRSTAHIAGCEVVHSVKEALALCKDAPELMIIGGAEIYNLFYPLATNLYITYIDADIKGDTHFLSFDKALWREVFTEAHKADARHAYDYCFVKLKRLKI
jgi:dihydrofolate reductase